MLKKTLVIIVAVLLLCSTSIVALAQDITAYASIPRPEPTDNVKYIVAQNGDLSEGYVYIISVPEFASLETNIIFQAAATSWHDISVYCWTSGIAFYLTIIVLDLNGNFIRSSQHYVSDMQNTNPFLIFSSPEFQYIDLFDIPLNDTNSIYTWGAPKIAWSETTDPNVLYSMLEDILSALSNTVNQAEEIISNANQNTDEIVSNANQNTEEIVSNQNQLQQNEIDDSVISGNDGINSIVGGIENKGQGFFNSMGNLISVMSYNGTDSKWTLPPITLPKIDGVMDSITLTDNLEIDFEYWIAQIPSTIMRVVQALCTIALIVYCVKELYSVLSYVFTLRGG